MVGDRDGTPHPAVRQYILTQALQYAGGTCQWSREWLSTRWLITPSNRGTHPSSLALRCGTTGIDLGPGWWVVENRGQGLDGSIPFGSGASSRPTTRAAMGLRQQVCPAGAGGTPHQPAIFDILSSHVPARYMGRHTDFHEQYLMAASDLSRSEIMVRMSQRWYIINGTLT